MPVTLVLGAQWGDEGKGKVVDVLSEEADFVARFQGGANAGHTVIVDGTNYILHLLPTGILHPNTTCIIGGGVVVDPVTLLHEIDDLAGKGIDINGRLFISHLANLILPYHSQLEDLSEKLGGDRAIGTTGRGIGPAYVDKMGRIGIRMVDLLDPDTFRTKLSGNIRTKNLVLEKAYGQNTLDPDAVVIQYQQIGERLKPYIKDTSILLNEAIHHGQRVLLEGAQGTLLDVDFGTYPYVTSSSTTAGGALTGLGIGPRKIDQVIGVVKAYITRVGNGPMPTEFPPELMETMREKGGEFGATTGRPRRVGWFDAVAAQYAAMINGIEGWAVTKLDVLSGMKYLNVAVAYRDVEGNVVSNFPGDAELLARCDPVYEQLDGWDDDVQDARSWEELPQKSRDYLEYIEDITGVPVLMVSVGPQRHQMIRR
jgi:adenylosuccinate synthase